MSYQFVTAVTGRDLSGACPRRTRAERGRRHADGAERFSRPSEIDGSGRDRSQTSFALAAEDLRGARLTELRSWFC